MCWILAVSKSRTWTGKNIDCIRNTNELLCMFMNTSTEIYTVL